MAAGKCSAEAWQQSGPLENIQTIYMPIKPPLSATTVSTPLFWRGQKAFWGMQGQFPLLMSYNSLFKPYTGDSKVCLCEKQLFHSHIFTPFRLSNAAFKEHTYCKSCDSCLNMLEVETNKACVYSTSLPSVLPRQGNLESLNICIRAEHHLVEEIHIFFLHVHSQPIESDFCLLNQI